VISQYEAALTSNLRTLYESSTRMFLDMFDIFAREGFDEKSMEDPEQSERMMQVMQNAWREITVKTRKIGEDIRELNARTYRSVHGALPVEKAREFRRSYFEAAYAEAVMDYGPVEAQIASALKMPDLSAENKASITVIRDDFRSKGDQIQDAAASQLDDFRKNQEMFDFDNEKWQAHSTKMDELRQKAAALNESTLEALKSAVGPERAERLTAAQNAIAEGGNVTFSATIGGGGMVTQAIALEGVAADEETQWGGDMFLPPAIGERDVAEYAKRLKLDETATTVMQSLLADYLERWNQVQAREVAALQKATQSLWAYNEETGQATPPQPKAIDECYRLRRAALEAIRKVDATFFDDVLVAVLTPADAPRLEPVRRMRECQTYNRGQYGGWGGWGSSSQESTIDLSRMVRRQELTSDETTALEQVTTEYEKSITDAFRERFEASLDFQQRSERFNVEMQAMQSDGGTFNPALYQQKYKELMEEGQTKMNQSNQKVRDINRTALEKMLEAMQAEHAAAMRNTYNRRAHPNVYNDPSSADNALNAALALTDLSADQKSRLNSLAAEYRPAYAAFCDQMVQLNQDAQGWSMGYDPELWREYEKRQQTLQKIGFDRNELNQRVVSRLKGMLTEDQLTRIGPLPNFEQANGMQMYMN